MANMLAKPDKPQRATWGNARFIRFLEFTDSAVYAMVGASFLIAAIASLCYGIAKFAYSLWIISSGSVTSLFADPSVGKLSAATALITLVSDLLLTLIIMEVMGTIVHYLRTRATTLKPFLFIGIISATRGVLAVGARLSVINFQTLTAQQFLDSMIELGVNAGVIIALGLSLRLIGRFLDDERSADIESRGAEAQPGFDSSAKV